MDTISTGQVTEAITAIVTSRSAVVETKWPRLKGTSRSIALMSDETCEIEY